MKVRDVGLDVHLDFCEVAICENGSVRSAGRVETTPERLELFAESLAPDDRVALEVTANSWEIARILEGHVARVIVVSPADTGMRQAPRRPIGWTRARWRGCSRPGSWMRCGYRTAARGSCAGAWRGAASSCTRGHASRTRSTQC